MGRPSPGMAASRLKGKPLLEINNVPIICHVLNKAKETGLEAIVATEDKEIATAIAQTIYIQNFYKICLPSF